MFNEHCQVYTSGEDHRPRQPEREKLFGVGLPRKHYTLHAKNHSNSYVRLLLESSELTSTSQDREAGLSLGLSGPTARAKFGTHRERREIFTSEALAPGAEDTIDVRERTQFVSVLLSNGRTNEYKLVRSERRVDDVKYQTFNVLSKYVDDRARVESCPLVDSAGRSLDSGGRSTNYKIDALLGMYAEESVVCPSQIGVTVEDFDDPEVTGISELYLLKLFKEYERDSRVSLAPHMHNFDKYIKFLREAEDKAETKDEKIRLKRIAVEFERYLSENA